MTIFIEGDVFPIDEKNVNGWGIKEAEVENAINSLKSSVSRICSRESPHGCDETEDPKSEIGNVVDSWRDGKWVRARVAVTDSVAEQKIKDGTWKNTWSIYGKAASVTDGWANGFNARSLTLVQNPAWKDASWEIAASEGGEVGLRTVTEFTLIASSQNIEGGQLTPEEEVENLKKEIEGKDGEIAKLGEQAGKVEGLEKQVGELGASVKDLEKKLQDKETLIASLEKKEAGSVPMEKVKELIASAITEHDAEQVILKANAEAREAFVEARKALGMETKADQFTALTAADFKEMTETLNVKLSASNAPVYPANEGAGTLKSPIFDPMTKTYSQGV